MTASRVFTIPPGFSFVDMLAQGLIDLGDGDPMALASMQILLPTRRACRSLREAFLKITDGTPLLLPRMHPVGDIDEDELSIQMHAHAEDFSLPPAMPALQRQFLLSRLIAAQGFGRGLEQDMALAAALGRLMDQAYTENLDLKKLETLVDGTQFAEHWQISLDFLSLISHHWPGILSSHNMIDAADRRRRLIIALSNHWAKNPPAHRIIAAGSTGSIPATADLLKVVTGLPNGMLVLPGLDQWIDAESWEKLDETHPQAMLRKLLAHLGLDRSDVSPWPAVAGKHDTKDNLRRFVSEVMRPAETSQQWQTVERRVEISPESFAIERYDCASQQEEALTIAFALRGVLEEPYKTAAVVTPDRTLARRVAMACRRWGIEIDDSGGQALTDTLTGSYLQLCLEAVRADMKPVALLSFCKHARCLPGEFANWRSAVRKLDAALFRGPALQNLAAYDAKIDLLAEEKKDTAGLRDTLSFVQKNFAPLLELATEDSPKPFADWYDAHLQVAESFCSPDILWAGQDGEAASVFFSGLREQSMLLPPITLPDYLALVESTMRTVAVRPTYGLHPRLMILGQLEARLIKADVMILSGLNEGSWPPKPSTDPWMSRPMRKNFGLPPVERSIGLSAHDFAQALCADKIILTRSVRVGGAPTVPSRWLQRMDTVLQAAGFEATELQRGPLLAQARLMDHTDDYKPVERPKPTPPVSARPRRLSVTKIDSLINDPYSIYARYILKLEPLEDLELPLDARARGELVHAILERFIDQYPGILPADALQSFMAIARDELTSRALEQHVRVYWEPRLEKIGRWLIATETQWREDMIPWLRECKGTIEFQGPAGPFTLSGIADRIDQSRDGQSAAIIDYKSGSSFSQAGMINGTYPQLPLEALIVEDGGFGDGTKKTVAGLAYWVLNGSGDGGKKTLLADASKLQAAKDNARKGLQALISLFDDESTPYYSLPRPDRAPRFNDYKHLARVLEWTALDEQDTGEEDAA
jgi:ATP-dependent helicase/nuclease subunit B